MKDLLRNDWCEDPFLTIGDQTLAAWATGPCSCRIQTDRPEIAKTLRKLPDCQQVGFSVAGKWVAIFAMPYTLDWVAREVVERIHPNFPRKNGGPVSQIGQPEAGAS